MLKFSTTTTIEIKIAVSCDPALDMTSAEITAYLQGDFDSLKIKQDQAPTYFFIKPLSPSDREEIEIKAGAYTRSELGRMLFVEQPDDQKKRAYWQDSLSDQEKNAFAQYQAYLNRVYAETAKKALVKVVNEALRSTKTLANKEIDVIKDDVLEGLTAVVTVRMSEPQFEGQTKEVLGTAAATRIVSAVVADKMKEYFNTTKRIDKANGRLVLEKIAAASRTRISARAHKDLQRRKNALESSSLPTKLSDCRSEDVTRTELFIVEGDSALGTTKAARNSEFQAILPIRGKILNVQKASLSQMLEDKECGSIIQVIGAGSGKSFELDEARYGRIILMSDADVDGAHIRCLLLTLMYRYMRPLIDSGRVFAAIPPLHRIEVVGGGGKKGNYIYTYSDDEMKKVTAELKKDGKRWKEPIQRYKGLGEMDADQLRETTMDPDARTLRRITVSDAAASEAMFELLMGSDVAPRKEFIANAEIDREHIDA